MKLSEFNRLAAEEARAGLASCCSSIAWQTSMQAAMPFSSFDEVLRSSSEIWFGLSEKDWLEGFAGHPRIGDKETIRKKLSASGAWSKHEQSGVSSAPEEVLENLSRLNNEYYEKFGFVFLIFATGKSAGEMLAALSERLHNSREKEVQTAALEHDKITKLRLGKLINEI